MDSFVEENGAKLFYKLGKENFVADALSRQHIYAMQTERQSDAATIDSELSLTYMVEYTDSPLTCYGNKKTWKKQDITATFDIFRDQKPTHNPLLSQRLAVQTG